MKLDVCIPCNWSSPMLALICLLVSDMPFILLLMSTQAQFLKVDIDSAELQDVVVKEQISAVVRPYLQAVVSCCRWADWTQATGGQRCIAVSHPMRLRVSPLELPRSDDVVHCGCVAFAAAAISCRLLMDLICFLCSQPSFCTRTRRRCTH